MNNKELFDDNINVLKKSPVFAMSLGSKELFHSNFWAYLMKQKECKSFISFFFKDIIDCESVRIEREDKNRDLVIYANNKEYVIENKIKSYPDLSQLEKYSKETRLERGVLTGINYPPFILPNNWSFISYHDISCLLRSLNFKDKYLELIVSDYCKVLDSINTLMKLALEETTNRLSYWSPIIDGLHEIRLMDVFRKNKADDFVFHCEDIKKEIDNEIRDCDGWSFYISRSFHNGKSTISYELQKGSEENYKGQIGIQIEDNQFRVFLGLNYKDINKIFKIGLEEGWFDSSFDKKNNRTIFSHPSTMSKNPCSYSGSWVYQYFDTYNDKVNPTVNIQDYSVLRELICTYLKKAVQIIKNKGNIIFK